MPVYSNYDRVINQSLVEDMETEHIMYSSQESEDEPKAGKYNKHVR